MFLVPLGNYDMVLGVQWLSTLGSVLWNFEELKMEFTYKGKRHIFRGTQKTDLEWLGEKNMQKTLCNSTQLFALRIQSNVANSTQQQIEVSKPQLAQLSAEFIDIFDEPKAYPLT